MTKKSKKTNKKEKKDNKGKKVEDKPKDLAKAQEQELLNKLPKDVQDKLKNIKKKLDKFKDQVLKKFDKYIVGIALLPPEKPPKPKEGEKLPDISKEKIRVMILVDDSDSKKMSKQELKEKLGSIIAKMADDIDKNIVPQTIILSELWQSCFDGKNELLQMIAMSAPVFDRGVLANVKVAEVHKTMVLKKFEKYIVSYVVAGSIMKGYAKPTSDLDVYIIIDDTDVKKMTRAELKDKLRAIIIGMGLEAGQITGVKNKLHVQVYILTDFWDSLREANPIIFTLLRDCVPFYDRGVFMPMKQLLHMGKIKPSPEAIDMFMGSGEQMLKRVDMKLKSIGMDDIFLAMLTPTQAALMLYGVAPPDPKSCGQVMRDIFVKKEKLLEDKFVKMYEKVHKIRKDIEHGLKKEVSGKEIDELLTNGKKYLARIKRLFTQIEKMKQQESVLHVYETIVTVIRDVLKMEGFDKVKEAELVSMFEEYIVSTGKIPAKYIRILNDIFKAKQDYDAKKLTATEVEQVKKSSSEFIRQIVEYMQRKRARELERTKVRVRYSGKHYGEVMLLESLAFITHDLDDKPRKISKASIGKDGSLGALQETNPEEMEKALAEFKGPKKAFLKQNIFESLEKIFGKDVEVLVN
tara:strand:+ start:834 stop:2732 length:1899 start_codon:yes stop_codon:yes gene_type:complete